MHKMNGGKLPLTIILLIQNASWIYYKYYIILSVGRGW